MCKLFITSAVCCQGEGVRASGGELKVWMVCTRDVYLPESKCLTGRLGRTRLPGAKHPAHAYSPLPA